MFRILAHFVCRSLEVLIAFGAVSVAFLIEKALSG